MKVWGGFWWESWKDEKFERWESGEGSDENAENILIKIPRECWREIWEDFDENLRTNLLESVKLYIFQEENFCIICINVPEGYKSFKVWFKVRN